MLCTSGPLELDSLESGGWIVTKDWWCDADELDVDFELVDGSAQSWRSRLVIFKGFMFDGGSFIAKDTVNGLQGFGAHDVRYRASRQGKFGKRWDHERTKSDRLMYRLHRHCGMSWFRAQYLWLGVRVGALDAARPGSTLKHVVAQ